MKFFIYIYFVLAKVEHKILNEKMIIQIFTAQG